MIQVQNITKDFGMQRLFEDASFLVSKRERIGIVGKNGSGKSTLFKMILGEECLDGGTILIPKNYTFGHLSQHLHFTQPTVFEEAKTVLKPNEDGWLDTHEMESILFGLGFNEESMNTSPELLSGGFQIRLNLAKVLAKEPNMLLLDEPTNYLDIVSTRWLSRFLKTWPGELLLITHDKNFMNSVCTHTVGIYNKKLRKVSGGVEKFWNLIESEIEVAKRTFENESKKKEQLEKLIERFRYKAAKAAMVQSKIKAVERLDATEIETDDSGLDFSFTEAEFPGKRLLQIKDLSFGYKENENLIENLSIEIFKGDRIGIIGPNGRGKTTLLNLIAKELTPKMGTISFNPNVEFNYFGQTNVNRLHMENTVEEEIQSALTDSMRNKARSLAGLMLFSGDTALKKIKVLSGGERARVLLAKILAIPCNLLLLDEPTNHLDMNSIESLLEALENYSGTSIIVSHDENLLKKFARRLIVFDGGRCFSFEGTYQEFLDKIGFAEERNLTNIGITEKQNPEYKKEDRKSRAEYVAMRSKIIKPLEKKIQNLETEIQKTEELAATLEQDLVHYSEKADGNKISEIALRLNETKNKTEELFALWESATEELETAKEKYPL